MKTKSLLLAFAGLGLFACSNEDLNEGGVQGDATVTVRINEAISRALETPTTGDNNTKFPVTINTATLTLKASKGGVENQNIKDQLTGSDVQSGEITFTQVRNPQELTLKINDGVASGLKLKDVCATGLAEPLYAVSTKFNQDSKDATKYTVTLTPEHRLARLQFSGINFKTEGSSYTSLKLDGIYLNDVLKTEGGEDKAVANDKGAWNTVSTTWTTDAPVFDAIGKYVIGGTPEQQEQGPWPKKVGEGPEAKSQCYAYNIFPVAEGTALPKLTVCFSEAVQPNVMNAGKERYARVATYKVEGATEGLEGIAPDGTIEEFKAGYIYNITNLMIEDKDLGPTPEGGEDITLVATVTVNPWTLVNGSVVWQ